MRFRFDQVASLTWHELLIYGLFLLIETLLFTSVFPMDYLYIASSCVTELSGQEL